MMPTGRLLIALMGGLLLTGSSVRAVPITFSFSGEVDRVEDANGVLAGAITTASTFSGTYTFNSDAVDLDADFGEGDYASTGGAYGWSIQIGSLSSSGTSVRIRTDTDPDDIYDVRFDLPVLPSGITSLQQSLRLLSTVGDPLGTGALPLAPPSLADFALQRQFDVFGGTAGGSFLATGTITVLTPEPGTGLLLGAGLASLGVARRCRRT
jgi:hypothetical protein